MVRRRAWRMVEVRGGWWRSAPLLVAAISSTVLHRPPPTSRTQSPVVLLATTTSTRDAGLRGLSDPVAAFRKVAERRGIFVSRGDQSGTHQREQLLWKRAGFPSPPRGKWYIESGQGMGATLQLADEKHGYTLTDRATYLTWRDKLQLFPMVEGDSLLYNVYHVLELNPKNASRINVVGGTALADFLVAPETQRLIGEYGKSRFGQSLFVPDAGKEPSR